MILQINKLVIQLVDDRESRREKSGGIYFDSFDFDSREMNVVSIRSLVYLVDSLNDVFPKHSDEKVFHDRMDYF